MNTASAEIPTYQIQGKQRSLTREQKQAIGLLSVGTLLEYFDLMLYVHMAVLLNELFFPKSDPHTAAIVTAVAFCSTYFLRPFGALLFGWIGDNIGRKITVIITTSMMSISCLIMANLPTYAEIGIAASWIISICRVMQGMSSMGEITGAQLYLTESISTIAKYPAVAMMNVSASAGGFIALGVATLVTSYGMNWRAAFWVGAVVAGIGIIARKNLRETPDFVDAKHRYIKALEKFNTDSVEPINKNIIISAKVNHKTSLALLLMDCMWPVCFYFAYMYCGDILKHSFGYTYEEIIRNNLFVAMIQLSADALLVPLLYYIYPLTILRIRFFVFSIVFVGCVFVLNNTDSALTVFIIQSLVVFIACDASPNNSIFFKHFPVFKRFTYGAFIYAASRALVYVVTSFGFIYLTKYFGNLGVLFIIVPIILGFAFGLNHFIKLERAIGNFPQKKLNFSAS